MSMSAAPGPVLAEPLPEPGGTPHLRLEAVREASGAVRDFRWTRLSPAAEALVRELEPPPGRSRWEDGVAAWVDVAACARVLETGEPHVGELRCRRGGAEVAFQAVVVREGEGVVLWLREGARAASAREEQLRLALETARMVTWEWTRARRAVTWSAQADAFFGQAPGTLGDSLGRFLACVCPEDRTMVARTIERGLTAGGPYTLRFRCRWADGSVHCYEAAGRSFHEGARAHRMVGVVVDCTEREQRVERMSEEARFRERFIGILGHDLRNPLNAIALTARALRRRGGLGTAQEEMALRIEATAGRMGKMIANILDLTRARLSGGIPLVLAPTRLSAVCRQVVEELRAGHPERSVLYEEDGDGEGMWDPERLAQVVGNLVGNALEHGAPDTPVFLTSYRQGSWQVLEVNNQGPPIPEHQLATLFDPFRQAGSASGGRRGGLGLGLFIVRELVRAHGGTVQVRSTEADGTRFTVRLPYDARPAAARGT